MPYIADTFNLAPATSPLGVDSIYTLDSLIVWLEKQDPEATYDHRDYGDKPENGGLLEMYLMDHGVKICRETVFRMQGMLEDLSDDDEGYTDISYGGMWVDDLGDGSDGYDDEQDFGSALRRAKVIRKAAVDAGKLPA